MENSLHNSLIILFNYSLIMLFNYNKIRVAYFTIQFLKIFPFQFNHYLEVEIITYLNKTAL